MKRIFIFAILIETTHDIGMILFLRKRIRKSSTKSYCKDLKTSCIEGNQNNDDKMLELDCEISCTRRYSIFIFMENSYAKVMITEHA